MGIPAEVFQIAGLAFSAISAFSQAKSQKNAYEYQAAVNRNNAQIAKWQAEDAKRRGDEAAAEHRRKVNLTLGTQRATLASRGLDLGSGSAWNTLSDTELFGAIDEHKIKQNAKRQAWSFENQANNYTAESNMLENSADNISPMMAAGGTLLAGAGAVADSWYKLNPTSAPSADSGYTYGSSSMKNFWEE